MSCASACSCLRCPLRTHGQCLSSKKHNMKAHTGTCLLLLRLVACHVHFPAWTVSFNTTCSADTFPSGLTSWRLAPCFWILCACHGCRWSSWWCYGQVRRQVLVTLYLGFSVLYIQKWTRHWGPHHHLCLHRCCWSKPGWTLPDSEPTLRWTFATQTKECSNMSEACKPACATSSCWNLPRIMLQSGFTCRVVCTISAEKTQVFTRHHVSSASYWLQDSKR